MEKFQYFMVVVYYIIIGFVTAECMLDYKADSDKKLGIALFWPVAVGYLIIRAFIGVYKIIDDALK